MSDRSAPAVRALNRAFIADHSLNAAKLIEAMPAEEAAEILAEQSVEAAVSLFSWLTPDVAANLIRRLPPLMAKRILEELGPNRALVVLGQFDESERQQRLASLEPGPRRELEELKRQVSELSGKKGK